MVLYFLSISSFSNTVRLGRCVFILAIANIFVGISYTTLAVGWIIAAAVIVAVGFLFLLLGFFVNRKSSPKFRKIEVEHYR